MDNISNEMLEKRISELEDEVTKLKLDIKETLQLISSHFSSELDRVMNDYRDELNNIAIKAIRDYKQHAEKFSPN
ncbi:hypothetical protein MKX34_17300 [Paenibacillus sp. FSL R5-0636]|uniref:hypothetical protein n=1 Tax=Paenibacillus TaxID=44249 RepID=UPI00096E5721|nr:hypothetical protein [Paenibacillus odorifer]OMD03460.1 hypothetical protein BJP49_01205 [Paenibacillus odorifer]